MSIGFLKGTLEEKIEPYLEADTYTMMKILDNLISGKATATAGGTVIELTEENRELATKIKDGLGEFDAVLQKYEDDKVVIYGMAFDGFYMNESILEGITPENREKISSYIQNSKTAHQPNSKWH